MSKLSFLTNEYETNTTPSQTIEQKIAIDILTGYYRPGSRLTEQQLAARFSISRAPLREILNRLSMANLIEIIPNRGAFVIGLTESDVNDLFYLKNDLLPRCVKWAVERISEEETDLLEDTFSFMEFYTAADDLPKMEKINNGFRAIIYHSCHNRELEASLNRYDFMIRYSTLDVPYPNNYLLSVFEENKAIMNAFRSKDPEAGYNAAQIHAYKELLRRKL